MEDDRLGGGLVEVLDEGAAADVRALIARNAVVFHGTGVEVNCLEPRTLRAGRALLYATGNFYQALSRSVTKILKERQDLRGIKPVRFGEYTMGARRYRFFSVHHEVPKETVPWGLVYVCPRGVFRPEIDSGSGGVAKWTGGRLTAGDNWIASSPVRPLARVWVHPYDLPGGAGWHTRTDSQLSTILHYERRVVTGQGGQVSAAPTA